MLTKVTFNIGFIYFASVLLRIIQANVFFVSHHRDLCFNGHGFLQSGEMNQSVEAFFSFIIIDYWMICIPIKLDEVFF